MCPRALRPTLAAILIALAFITLLPADFASAAQSSAQANRPKRGKNGQRVADSGSQSAPARKTTSPTVEQPGQESEPVEEDEDTSARCWQSDSGKGDAAGFQLAPEDCR